MVYTLVDEMVLNLELRNFGEAGPLEVLRLNLGPSGVHIEELLKLRKKVKKTSLSTLSLVVQVQDLLVGLTPDSIITTTETVSTCLRFFLRHCQVKDKLFCTAKYFEFSRVHRYRRRLIYQSRVQAYPFICNFISGKVQ